MRLNKFIQALAVLMGTIIGVGAFALPYVTAQVSIWVVCVYFIGLGTIVILVSWIYGEVTLRTKGLHRLPGYAKKYLGRWGEITALVTGGVGFIGAMLAYLVVGGGFLANLVSPLLGGGKEIYILIYFAIGAFLIYHGVRSIAQAEFVALIAFFIVLIFAFKRAFPLIEFHNLNHFDIKHVFLPYGVVLFSLIGTSVVPELKDILKDRSHLLKKVILLGSLIPALIYLVFIITITGITGSDTSQDAITGLSGVMKGDIVTLMLIFGILSTFTSFLTCGITLKKIFWYDFKVNKHLSWALTVFIPLILCLAGFDNLVTIISLTGGIFLGVDIILIMLIFKKAKSKGDLIPVYSLKISNLVLFSLIGFFVLGAIYEIIHYIR